MRGSSKDKLYQELGFESLQNVVGIENYAVFTKYLKMKVRVIYSI